MRALKFRCWDIDNKEFVYVSETTDGEIWINNGISTVAMPEHKTPYEQYTGLKDKNGKEIYEGDIVNVIGIGIAQVIDSPTGEWMLYYMREPDEINNGFVSVIPKNKPSGLWKTNTTSYIEVIGNIHEPPKDFRPEHLKRMGVSISKGGEK